MATIRWRLEDLPPSLRAQAEYELGGHPAPQTPSTAAIPQHKVFVVPNSTPPEGSFKPQGRRGGVFKANTLTAQQNASLPLPAPSPAGFKSIAEMRAEKKATKRRKTLTPDMANSIVKSCNVSENGDEVKFVLNVDPYMLPTAQQKGAFVGKDHRVHFFTKAKVAKSEKALRMALTPYANRFENWKGFPIYVSIDFFFPFPKTTSKKNLIEYSYHTTRPDLDNLEKGLSDALTEAGFWEDDSVIAELHLRKFRTITTPRIVLTVKKMFRGDDMFWGRLKDIF